MSHSPSIWRQGPLYRGTAACEETEHGLVLTNWHRILLVVVVAEQAASTRQNCWQMHFVDLTRTSFFPSDRTNKRRQWKASRSTARSLKAHGHDQISRGLSPPGQRHPKSWILPCGRHNLRATSLARLGMTSRLTFSPSVNPQPASVEGVRFPLFF